MDDPLQLLREFITSDRDVTYDEATEELVFADVRVPKTAKTSWHKKSGDPYTILEVWFAFQNEGVRHPLYVVNCSSNSVTPVSLPDRAKLADYIKGKGPHAGRSVPDLPAPEPVVEAAVPLEAPEAGEPQQKRRRVAAAEDVTAIYAEERQLVTRTSVLQNKKKNFASLGLMVQRLKKDEQEQGRRDTRENPRPTPAVAPHKPLPTSSRRSGLVPIIIVPSSRTSPLNICNARSLLESGAYVSWDEGRKRDGITNSQLAHGVTVNRAKPNGDSVPYLLIHNTRGFTDKEWDRVVAVFATGKVWQFRDWKWTDPVDLFERCLGCHVRFENEAPDGNIARWNVRVYAVNKFKRHLDMQVMVSFWKDLDQFARRVKPHIDT